MMCLSDMKIKKPIIKATKFNQQWVISIDGKTQSLTQAAERVGIHPSTLGSHIRSSYPDDLQKWYMDRMIINQLGLPHATILYFRGDEVCWTNCVADTTPCCIGHALTKLKAWVSGFGDYDDLFRPPMPKWKGKFKKPYQSNEQKFDCDMGPRKAPWEIPCAGSWERDNIPESTTGTISPTNHLLGYSSTGTIYRGD